MSILTKEVIQKILNDDWLLMDDCEGLENCTVIKELARIALDAIDSEPVAYIDKQWTLVYYVPPMSLGLKIGDKLYRHAQPAPERKPVKRFNADQMHRICLEANRHFDKYGAMAKEVNKLLGRTPAQPAPEKYNIGDATMRHIFTQTGMTDVSDMQAVFDRVEAVLVGMEQPALVVLDRSIFENWWESQNGSPLDGWDSLRTIDGYCDDGIDGQFEAWSAAMLNGGKS
ncbi:MULTISPECIES: hypothetical protein [Klebsiella]|uniref:hypothetical protein n=1 Tax=Klebsiella TaxID=570 RepID=UPI0020B7CC25|nr:MULTISPECIES: hypothetical protein [Klebsiella]